MGFLIPESPNGMLKYKEVIECLKNAIQNREENTIVGCITSVFIETEKLLKDLILFYGACLTHEEGDSLQKRQWAVKEIENEILRICKKYKINIQTLDKVTFGNLVAIIRSMEKHIKGSPKLIDKLVGIVDRKTILDDNGNLLDLLDKICSYRKYYVHDVKPKNPSLKNSLVLSSVTELSQKLENFCPIPIFGHKIIMDNFGTFYLMAKDEKNKEYTIYSRENLDSDFLRNQFLMKPTNSYIIINPILVLRV